MRYINESGSVVNVLSGGPKASAVLESMGYKTEDVMSKKKTAAAPKKAVKNNTAIVPVEPLKTEKIAESRQALMLEVQRRGVKNFRVMNKEELGMIVAGATKAQIEAIQLAAVTRWKSGWGKEGKRQK